MKKIAVVTATRAEYGLLAPLIKQLRVYETATFTTELIVTGTHLSASYGNTIQEILADNIRIDHIIKISVESESELDISRNQADALIKFTELFLHEKYKAVILLGDRYETLSIAIAAGNTRTPIFHLCGGDTTEGAIDEWIRHSITKISYLHFPTNNKSRDRIIQLGEAPERIFNYGSTSIDNIINQAVLSKKEALNSIGLIECRYAVCTYHPVTLEDAQTDELMQQFLSAIANFPDIEFIVTKSNADQGGARINNLLDMAEKKINNLHVFYSLGVTCYLSLMRYAEFVLGNSSSGIIEAPAFKIPTIDIGNRQRGRLRCESIINCNSDTESIVAAINTVNTTEFRNTCNTVVSAYGDGHAAKQIAEKVIETIMNTDIDLKKKFYDIGVNK